MFRRVYSIDEEYLITIADTVENSGSQSVSLFPYALVTRQGIPETQNFFILHEGLIGYIGEQGLQEVGYDDLMDEGELKYAPETNGWLGMTDKYWAAAIVPTPGEKYTPRFFYRNANNRDSFQADFLGELVEIAPGSSKDHVSRLFAGAKEVNVINSYRDNPGIERFDLMIDWGWFYFITKPMFVALDWLYKLIGNFGLAILAVTVVLKIFFFPLANKSYASMANMKKVQPQLTELRERYKDDRARQQQAMMELYKKEKINPLAGCLPVVLQIPVFFALYKVLFVTIEMRHAPFFGWIRDLAAPADAFEPDATRQNPGDDLHLDAGDIHIHAGLFPCRPGDLLGLEQHPVDLSAVPYHAPPGCACRDMEEHQRGARTGWQGAEGKGLRAVKSFFCRIRQL